MRWRIRMARLDKLLDDTRYALRTLARDRGVALVVMLTLALGVGVNAATFAVLDRLYLRAPAGVEDPATLRRVWVWHSRTEDGKGFASTAINWGQFRAMAAVAPDSTRLALYFTDHELHEGPTRAAPPLSATWASASYWRVLGIRPALGRLFTADEDRPGA